MVVVCFQLSVTILHTIKGKFWVCRGGGDRQAIQGCIITLLPDPKSKWSLYKATKCYIPTKSQLNKSTDPKHDFAKLWQIKVISATLNVGQDLESEGVQKTLRTHQEEILQMNWQQCKITQTSVTKVHLECTITVILYCLQKNSNL